MGCQRHGALKHIHRRRSSSVLRLVRLRWSQGQCLRTLHSRRRTGSHGFIDDFDALQGPRLVRILVLLRRVVVPDLDTLDIHAIRLWWRQRRVSTSPRDGSRMSIRIATAPKAQAHFHGSLWVLFTVSIGISGSEGTYDVVVDRPYQLLCGPVNGIGMESCLRSCDRVGSGAIVFSRDAFTEIVGLHAVGDTTAELPVDLV